MSVATPASPLDTLQAAQPTQQSTAPLFAPPLGTVETSPAAGALPSAVETYSVQLRVNGESYDLAIESWVSLLDLLRDRLNLTGTKKGCDHGQCGACTVLIDGERVLSCLTLAVMRNGCDITTVEGLSSIAQPDAETDAGGQALAPIAPSGLQSPTAAVLHTLQQAFMQHDAFQCGYCTPGQLCSAVGLINEGEARTVDQVRELMSGNLCRCGAYPQITAAVCQVALGQSNPVSRTAHGPVVTGTVPA